MEVYRSVSPFRFLIAVSDTILSFYPVDLHSNAFVLAQWGGLHFSLFVYRSCQAHFDFNSLSHNSTSEGLFLRGIRHYISRAHTIVSMVQLSATITGPLFLVRVSFFVHNYILSLPTEKKLRKSSASRNVALLRSIPSAGGQLWLCWLWNVRAREGLERQLHRQQQQHRQQLASSQLVDGNMFLSIVRKKEEKCNSGRVINLSRCAWSQWSARRNILCPEHFTILGLQKP